MLGGCGDVEGSRGRAGFPLRVFCWPIILPQEVAIDSVGVPRAGLASSADVSGICNNTKYP